MALPAPQDPVDICNLSLSILSQGGEKGNYVANIDTPTTNEEYLCKKHFPQQRRATLRGHPCNFAIKRVQLAASATAPIFGFSKAFDLPADYIRFLTRHGDFLGEAFVWQGATREQPAVTGAHMRATQARRGAMGPH